MASNNNINHDGDLTTAAQGRDIYFECVPFASGGQRLAFYGYYDMSLSQSMSSTPNLVVKLDMATTANCKQNISDRIKKQHREVQHTVRRHQTMSSLVDKWHSLGVSKTIIVLEAHALTLCSRPPSLDNIRQHGLHQAAKLYEKLHLQSVLFKSAVGTVEDFVPGHFTKFLNNDGSVNPHLSTNFASAFAHWSWHISRNTLMVSDIQGVRTPRRYVLTDPALHSATRPSGGSSSQMQRQYHQPFGMNDLGVLGIKSFFQKHQCNDLCRDLNLPQISPLASLSSALAADTPLPFAASDRLGHDFDRAHHQRHAAAAAATNALMPIHHHHQQPRRRIRPVFCKRRLHSTTQTDGSDHASLSATTQSPCDSDNMPNSVGTDFEPASETDPEPDFGNNNNVDSDNEPKTRRRQRHKAKRLTDSSLVRASGNIVAGRGHRVTVEGKITTTATAASNLSDDSDDDNSIGHTHSEWKSASVIDGFPATRVNQDDLKMFGQRRRHHTNNRTANLFYTDATASFLPMATAAPDSPCAIANTNGLFNNNMDDDDLDEPMLRKGLVPALGSGIPSVGAAARGMGDRKDNSQRQSGPNGSYGHSHIGGQRRSMWLFGKRASLRDVMQASASISGDFGSSTGQQQAAREARHATRRGTGRVKRGGGRRQSWQTAGGGINNNNNNMTGNHNNNNGGGIGGGRRRMNNKNNNNAPGAGQTTNGDGSGGHGQRNRQSGGRRLLGRKGLKAALIGRLPHVGGSKLGTRDG